MQVVVSFRNTHASSGSSRGLALLLLGRQASLALEFSGRHVFRLTQGLAYHSMNFKITAELCPIRRMLHDQCQTCEAFMPTFSSEE